MKKNATMDVEEVRQFITNFKQGVMKTPELCDEIVSKARSFLVSEKQYKEYLDFSARFYKYSFNNTMLIKMQNQHATYVGSYKHFKDIGYNVRRGQHGYTILVPVVVKLFERNGELIKLKDATPDEKFKISSGELTLQERIFFKPGTVFDISQTTIAEDELPGFLKGMKPRGDSACRYQQLSEFVEGHGIKIVEEDFQSVSLNGKYRLADDSIHINERMNVQNKYATLLHEFAHAIMHKNATGMDLNLQAIEFEAESVAYMVLRLTGADVSDYSFQYITQYYQHMNDDDVGKSLRRIDAAAGYISSHLEMMQPEGLPVSFPSKAEVPLDPNSEKNLLFHAVRSSDFMEESPYEGI